MSTAAARKIDLEFFLSLCVEIRSPRSTHTIALRKIKPNQELPNGLVCLGRPRFCHHLDHGHRQGLSLAWLRTRQGVTYQLHGQNGFESSSRVVCRTAKFVSPIGLRHAANGDTNCACLPFNAKSMRLSGTFVDAHGFLLSASPVQPTLMTAAKYVRTSVSSSGWNPRRKKSCWCPI
jgi:hypothetical protein